MVACLMLPCSEYVEGIILGAVYNKKDKAPFFSPSHKIKGITYEDGTSIYYDKENSILKVDCVNEVLLNCKNLKVVSSEKIAMDCNELDITANRSINIKTGKIDVDASLTRFNHGIEAEDLKTLVSSFNTHNHISAKEGTQTSAPTKK